MSVPAEYRDMLRTALREEKSKEALGKRPVQKRRRKRIPEASEVTKAVEVAKPTPTDVQPQQTSTRLLKIKQAIEREKELKRKQEEERCVIELSTGSEDEPDIIQKAEPEVVEDEDDAGEGEMTFSDVEFESDDFEDIDMGEDDDSAVKSDKNVSSSLTVKIRKPTVTKKRKQRPTVVSSEERVFRRTCHILYLFAMVGHGKVRNEWINNEQLLMELRDQLPNVLKREYLEYDKCRKDAKTSTGTRTRKLLDLLRHLMNYWVSEWTIDPHAPLIYKKTWSEIQNGESPFLQKRRFKLAEFKEAVLSHSGSRDLSAQGFCALLRSLSLGARLVFSLQPPDFTNMIECKVLEKRQGTEPTERPKKKPKKVISQKERLLDALTPTKIKNKLHHTPVVTSNEFGSWPVFWVEVWDKDAKKYVTIDPAVKHTIEVVVNKSKLEPPMNCIRNNAWYVVGYDRLGGVRDITRRYAKEYNAKVRKKRIDRELKWTEWWPRLLKGACSPNRVNPNRVDKFEEIDFNEFHEREGMPSSIADFKSHPVYVLESDLKWNEVLEPMVSCGTIRKKTKNGKDSGLLPVYKRSNVVSLRTPKGWYMRGRVLKVGERPMKVYKGGAGKTPGKGGARDTPDSDDDTDKRLYAESQTELYVPPPVTNGKIPRNAYKNIDVYEPWMVPAGTVHIQAKESEKAARLMGLEYAPAVVGFDFEGGRRREVKAKVQGIVTLEQYGEAVALVAEFLKEQKDEDEVKRKELLILRSWRVFLTKLQIKNRLIEDHGEVFSSEEEESEQENRSEIDYDQEYAGFLPSAQGRARIIDEDDGAEAVADSDLEVSDFDDDQALDVSLTPAPPSVDSSPVKTVPKQNPRKLGLGTGQKLVESDSELDEYNALMDDI